MTRVTTTAPTVGGSSGTWGTTNNANIAALATAVNALGTAADHNIGDFAVGMTVTAVKTANYSAAANEIVRCDSSGGTFAVTLPTAPADGTRQVIKKVDATGTTVTITCGGADVFNVAAGSTSVTLPAAIKSSVFMQYQASGALWVIIATDAGSGVIYAGAASFTADVAMGSHKITGLANGSASTDAAAFGQIPQRYSTALTAGSATNTTSDTVLATATTIPAAVLTTSTLIVIDLFGNIDCIATSGAFNIKLKIGSTTVASALTVAASQTSGASALSWSIHGILTVETTGAGGVVSFTDSRLGRVAAGTVNNVPSEQALSVSVDLSSGIALTVVASMGTANAGNVLRLLRGAVIHVV